MMRRWGPIVSLLVLAAISLGSIVGGAEQSAAEPATSDVPQKACTPLPAVRAYGVRSDGSATNPGTPGSGLVQEYSTPQGATLASIAVPDGFNPANATNAELAVFHIPPRPSDAGALTEWVKDYGHPLYEAASSAPCMTDEYAASATSRTNWSGRVAVGSGFTDVSGYWTQPNFVPYCLHASTRAIWNGLGGWGSGGTNKILQAGSYTTDLSGSNINKVSAFVEVYDREAIQLVNPPAIRTGDSVNVRTLYSSSSGGTATWQFSNRTTGVNAAWYETGASAYYDGTHANYIDERTTDSSNNQLRLLRKSTNTTFWSGEYVNGQQSNSFPTINVTMMDTDTLMTALMGATITSSEAWKDCGPGLGLNQ